MEFKEVSFSEEHKKAVHDAEFPKMLDLAFKIGAVISYGTEITDDARKLGASIN